MHQRARAFSPAGISSFFEICDQNPDGTHIDDLERVGARGGGFGIDKGVFTEVVIADAEKSQIQININGKVWPEAETTRAVVETLLEKKPGSYRVTVDHHVEVPIGSGFGSSAAGALGTALALSEALNLNLTHNQLGKIAHVAEVRCLTGLGTVGPLLHGGCAITTEPGAPGYANIDRIPVSPDHRVIACTYKPFPTKEMLSAPHNRNLINEMGRRTLKKILATPSLENFLRSCKEFAIETGLITPRVHKLINIAEGAGAIGAAQNMVGEAVHILVREDRLEQIVQSLKKEIAQEKIIIAKIDLQGARRLG